MRKELSIEQQDAKNSIYGKTLVVSCPGSGKTTVIIERIVTMLERGIEANQMLNITFTKAAAMEMGERFHKCYARTDVKFSTIHAFCYQLLVKELAYTQNSIFKESDKYAFILQKLLETKQVLSQEMEETIKDIMQGISYVKNSEIPYKQYSPENCRQDLFRSVYVSYEAYKQNLNKIDFDDMLLVARQTLQSNPQLLATYQEKYPFITIDEFQDVNKIQADICYLLAGDSGNLFVVGDDDQSIYGFRAADSTIMLNFKKRFPDAKIIYMSTNYRSGNQIVKYASRLIQNNQNRYQKKFIAGNPLDGRVFLQKCEDSRKEVEYVLNRIEKEYQKGNTYDSMAILYRNNQLAVPFIAMLMKKEIPFYTSEVPKDHHEGIFQDFLAYWRLANGQYKKGDLQKILNRPSRYLKSDVFQKAEPKIGECLTLCNKVSNRESAANNIIDLFEDLKILATMDHPVKFINYIVDTMDYRKWLSSYAEYRGKDPEEDFAILNLLYDEAKNFETMEQWMLYAKRYSVKLQEIKKQKKREGVCLSTFHSSKGLEWDTVYVVHCNDGITPFAKAETVKTLEEERRMFYVAITRPKNSLHITYISGEKSSPSPYLDEMGFTTPSFFQRGNNQQLHSKYGLGRTKKDCL